LILTNFLPNIRRKLNKVSISIERIKWRILGSRFYFKIAPTSKFEYSLNNDYLIARLIKDKKTYKKGAMLFTYCVTNDTVSATIFDEKTKSFTNRVSLPFSQIIQSGVDLSVFKYGYHFREAGIGRYLLKSFFKVYYFTYKYHSYKHRVTKFYKGHVSKRPDYLNLRITLLEFAINGRFEGKHNNNNGFTYTDVMSNLFGKHWIYIKDEPLHSSNVKFVLHSLVGEGLLNFVPDNDIFSSSLTGLSYLEAHYQSERRHNDSRVLQGLALVFAAVVGWDEILKLLVFIKELSVFMLAALFN